MAGRTVEFHRPQGRATQVLIQNPGHALAHDIDWSLDRVGGGRQAAGQVQATRQQLGLIAMMYQALLQPRNLQAHDAVEIILLVEMEQDLAILEILRGRR